MVTVAGRAGTRAPARRRTSTATSYRARTEQQRKRLRNCSIDMQKRAMIIAIVARIVALYGFIPINTSDLKKYAEI